MKQLFFILCTVLLLTACEKRASITYLVKNSTNSTITLIFKGNKSGNSKKTILIPDNTETTLKNDKHGLNRVSYYKEKGENLSAFSQIDVYKNDSLKSKTNFLKTSEWSYEEVDKHFAIYSLFVNDSDF